MTYKVDNDKDEVEATGLSLPDAIRRAMASGEDVYVHDDKCPAEHELGPRCLCNPVRIPGRDRPSTMRSPFRPVFRGVGGRRFG